ncbi:hypothetical protein HMN09_00292500 [Mycena chlorophos]|uniref:F-box domain-containing protein n=1 Tax=Mycena chlorophos TaxID=658473 RepID=A0A8H6WJR6_MYCCL|nr:hypothetical protein HMN09_00292500 [Mycena chlorophos]
MSAQTQDEALEEEFNRLDAEASQLILRLSETLTKRNHVRRNLAQRNNARAPLLALPDELLIRIVDEWQLVEDARHVLAAVRASQICQRFHSAVMNAGTLWSTIRLFSRVYSTDDQLAAYLMRSKDCALSMNLDFDFLDDEDTDYILPELPVLWASFPRMRRFSVHAQSSDIDLSSFFFDLHDIPAPSLEHLDIAATLTETEIEDQEPSLWAPLLAGAPRLKSAVFQDFYLDSTVPWIPQLQHLYLGYMSIALPGRWDGVLTAASQLVNLTLDGSAFSSTVKGGSIKLPNLRSLRVLRVYSQVQNGLISGSMLTAIEAPILENMEFTQVHGRQIVAFFQLLRVAQYPLLKAVTFASSLHHCSDCSRQPAGIPDDALRRFSNLESLTLSGICYTSWLLNDLLRTAKEQKAGLPALRLLSVDFRWSEKFGSSQWPALVPSPSPDDNEPLHALRRLVRARNAPESDYPPLGLRVSRSQYFLGTPTDWSEADGTLEVIEIDPVLRDLEFSVTDIWVNQ